MPLRDVSVMEGRLEFVRLLGLAQAGVAAGRSGLGRSGLPWGCSPRLSPGSCGDEQSLPVKPRLTTILCSYGLPHRIQCDNGPLCGMPGRTGPETGWAARGVWILRLGIRVSHGRPPLRE